MKNILRTRFGLLAGLAMLAAQASHADTVNVTSADISGNVTWYRTNTYVLQEMVFVENGETLTIEAGTVVKGKEGVVGSGTAIPSLVISQGGKIYAEGTPTQPIIFTAESDDVSNPADKSIYTRGLWGGVVILGKATINSSKNATGQSTTPKYDVFEGLPDQTNLRFGGNDDADNSGIMRYVSIRHGGTTIDVNKEINGLSLGGVGNGTTIEFIEVYANDDDGFEFFGGTVNTKYLISAFVDDDAFDTDQGYSGKNQFWFAIQAPTGNRNYGGEYAGDPVSPFNRTPLSAFTVYNATYIGAGVANPNSKDNTVFDLKEDTAAKHYNSIFTEFTHDAVKLQASAQTRFDAGDIDLRNNVWFGFGNGTGTASLVLSEIVNGNAQALFTDSTRTNLLVDPQLRGVSRAADGLLDPRPTTGSPALNGTNVKVAPAGYTTASYLGAFGTVNWAADWSALNEYGILTAQGGGTPAAAAGFPTQGPSSSQSPQIEALADGVTFSAILTVGDSVNNKPDNVTPYRFVGKPDGMGALDNGDGTFTAFINHELSEGEGVARRHGAIGAFVSKWIINKSTLEVMNGSDLITNVYVWDGANFIIPGTNVVFGRFCSADLPPVSAFYNSTSGNGTQNRIFMNGEEFSTESRAWAHIASGPNAGDSWQLPRLGRASWENVVASPYMQDKTIVVGLDDDGTTDSQVYIYIGTKGTTGSDVEKAGLLNGTLYGVAVTGLAQETAVTTGGTRNFTLANLGDVSAQTFNGLETLGNGLNVTAFMRVEDGHWDPNNPTDFYFLTTASSSLPSRLWRLRFTDIANPESGGTITMILDGTEGQLMMDNMTVDGDSNALITEDPGNNARLARVWKYFTGTGGFVALAQSRNDLFTTGQANFITQDEEVSGIIDVRDILGEGAYLLVNQIHSGAAVGNDVELDEGGQLLVMQVNSAAPSISTQPASVGVSSGNSVTFSVSATVGADIQWYFNGVAIPGATGTTYDIPSPTTAKGGSYYAVITTAGGSVVSGAAVLTVADLAMYAGITVAGPLGAQYNIDYTTSLTEPVTWTPLTTITLSSSPMLYVDTTSAGQPRRFYRAVQTTPQ
ncbi:MAG: immunoglobulin domain-containing protein [Verrucomicrobiota bacterium]